MAELVSQVTVTTHCVTAAQKSAFVSSDIYQYLIVPKLSGREKRKMVCNGTLFKLHFPICEVGHLFTSQRHPPLQYSSTVQQIFKSTDCVPGLLEAFGSISELSKEPVIRELTWQWEDTA